MRRADISRKLNKIMSIIDEEVLLEREIDFKHICFLVRDELTLKNGKEIKTKENLVTNFKDLEFEGTVQNKNIYEYDDGARTHGIQKIKNICGIVQIKYNIEDSRLELNLIVEVEYIDNQNKKHKAFPCLKSLETIVNIKNKKEDEGIKGHVENKEEEEDNNTSNENTRDIANNDENVGENRAEDNKEQSIENIEEALQVKEDIDKSKEEYMNNINSEIERLFGERFFHSKPSLELLEIIINKLHSIYLKSYLEECFKEGTKNKNNYCVEAIERIIESL